MNMSKRPASSLDACMGINHVSQGSKKRHKFGLEEQKDVIAPPGANNLDQPMMGISLPPVSTVTPWLSSEIPTQLPSLPGISDSELEKQVFTHPGLGIGQSYERLEWLGDAYLELIASSLIFQTFGRTPSGRCSQLRELLIRNTTLAEYFQEYGMSSRARLPVNFGNGRELGRGRSRDKDLLKTRADMFEAYVAAVILSDGRDGLAKAITWLKALWGRTIRDHILQNEKHDRASHPLNVSFVPLPGGNGSLNAKDKLAATIGAKGILIRYQDIPGVVKDKDLNLPLYTVGVYLDGWGEQNKLLGTGTALKKQEAGHKAAARALENKKMIKVFEEKKKAFQVATKAAEEASGRLTD